MDIRSRIKKTTTTPSVLRNPTLFKILRLRNPPFDSTVNYTCFLSKPLDLCSGLEHKQGRRTSGGTGVGV